MNELLDKAIAHITEQAMKLDEQLTYMIEEHLTNICTTEQVANKLLDEEKTLEKLNKDIWNLASKRKKGNGAHIPDAEIFEISEKYYGITEEDKNIKTVNKRQDKKIVNIMDLL